MELMINTVELIIKTAELSNKIVELTIIPYYKVLKSRN